MSQYFLRRNRRMGVGETSSPTIDPLVTSWTYRVVNNGGAAPSNNTNTALSIFMRSLYDTDIYKKMIVVNPLVPDSLIASLTPLILVNGNSLWTNNSFVSGDLTVNGLTGNGTTKYLKTGILASNVYSSVNDNGLTVYVSSGSNGNHYDVGTYQSNTQFNELRSDMGGSTSYDCYNSSTGRLILTTPTTLGIGFYCSTRTNSTNEYIYVANSVFPFSQVAGPGGSSAGTLPTIEYYVFTLNNIGSPLYYSTKCLSFVAFHHGLSSSEAQSLYNAIQTLRTALGGGYV